MGKYVTCFSRSWIWDGERVALAYFSRIRSSMKSRSTGSAGDNLVRHSGQVSEVSSHVITRINIVEGRRNILHGPQAP
jgi:hypothetical protein